MLRADGVVPGIPAASNNPAGTDDTPIPSPDDSYFPTWGMPSPASSPTASPQSAVSPSPVAAPPAASPSPQPADMDTANTTDATGSSGNLPAGNVSVNDQPQPRGTGAPQPLELPVQAGGNSINNPTIPNTPAVNQPAAADVPTNQTNSTDNSPVLDLPLDEPYTAPSNPAGSEPWGPQVDVLTPDDTTNQGAPVPDNQTMDNPSSADLPVESPEPEPATPSNSSNIIASPSIDQGEEPTPLPTNGTNSTLESEAIVVPTPDEQNTTVPTNSTTATAPEADTTNTSSPPLLPSPNVSVATNQSTDPIPVPTSDTFTFNNPAASPGLSIPILNDGRNDVAIPTTDLQDNGASPSPAPVPSPSPVGGEFACTTPAHMQSQPVLPRILQRTASS